MEQKNMIWICIKPLLAYAKPSKSCAKNLKLNNQNTMTTEKTARAWFEMLKEPYRSQAIEASEKNPYPEKQETYESLTDAIVYDFWWSETELDEGWQEIHDSLERGETTYLADEEHECKYCGVMTTQPDEECYKATTDTTDVKDLEYWKKNAEDNYMTTPISVLKYITELEKAVIKQLHEPPTE